MPDNLSPVGLSTYIRLDHLQKTVTALEKNFLAGKTELFIFSDGPKNGDEKKVSAVRRYLKGITGFRKVHIFARKENNRVVNNRGGIADVLDKYNRIIFLEEDVVTAPGFLNFMNQALDRYEESDQFFSITGYCPPISIPENYPHDVFLLRRFNAWGFGIWKDRFEHVKYVSPSEYERLSANKRKAKLFADSGGEDMIRMLKLDAYGKIDAFDVKAMYAQFMSDQYTVYPTCSLSSNIGMDGSGIHCGYTTKFNVKLTNKDYFTFPTELAVDDRIVKENLRFRARESYRTRIMRKLRGKFNKIWLRA